MTTYIITFLGTSRQETAYVFEGKEYKGQVFPEALIQFATFDKMFVCVTEGARKTTLPILTNLNDERIEPIDIEDGENTQQMWQNFNTIVSKFQAGDKVIFDITHAVRSLPFLTFLFSAYLKVAKDVQIKNIYYGALALGKPTNKPTQVQLQATTQEAQDELPTTVPEVKTAPVIKMGEFVSMLDWMSATQRFIDLGDGNGLVKLLKDLAIEDTLLKKLVDETAEAIELVSDALIYIRPIEVMTAAANLQELIPQLEVAGQKTEILQPFILLSEKINNQYQSFALKEYKLKENTDQNLKCQLKIVSWYREKRQQVKAIVLLRELFVSILAYWLKTDPFNEKDRQNAQNILNDQRQDVGFDNFKDKAAIVEVWNNVKEPRNDYAHLGFIWDKNTNDKDKHKHKSIRELKSEIDNISIQSEKCLQDFLDAAQSNYQQNNSRAIARPSTKSVSKAIPKPRLKK